MSTRFAGSALVAWALSGCSGVGAGADACRTLEHARCARQAECDDWSDSRLEDCRVERDAACRAGAIATVRDAGRQDVDACADALGAAACEALADPATIPECAAVLGQRDE